ncbi:hypothetical protein D1007_52680 [Hordeum vulgare]|uniref:Predicted protein n=1 Tax=Hordeum vulgare subsp. vulgare TaxID=112509 RepID=F2CX85_HORVV|nr:uncharacterized protein LOC123402450 [Hordeum vulgare subsp. vulgare]KAE8774870.1 hypothetical protein D1007_52680 [Hordeum vulgare]KAI4981024.1 hypothetical protein ZWY2020_021509 [Hordeum vulgare]BAJ87456.1 predicted protein [Hordeum vulgare subsp. vulgare]
MELEAAPQLPRRDARKLVRCPRLQLDAKTVTAVEQSTGTPVADAAATSPGGAMRVKILLSKQQLKQVAAAVAAGGAFGLPPALEQLVSAIKRQHAKKQAAPTNAAAARRPGRWSPALHSIPEDISYLS